MKIQLDTPFKGSRHYIQGGDLFNAIQDAAAEAAGEQAARIGKLAFTHFAYHLCELVLDEAPKIDSVVAHGELVLSDGRRKNFVLCEGRDTPAERRPYDEEGMVESASFAERSATLRAPIQYTSIEAVIALTKVLNYRLATPASGKWVFGGIELSCAMPPITDHISIRCAKSIPGRFSVNEIVIDGRNVGNIQFIVGMP